MNYNAEIVSSHQPHFFPWLGYFDKMAKASLFLINDVAQLELKSPMIRNKILKRNGEVQFINAVVDRTNYQMKMNREICLKDWEETRRSILGKLKHSYGTTEFFPDVWSYVQSVLEEDYTKLIDLEMATIETGRKLLNITTPIEYHSHMNYKAGETTSERLAMKLESIGTSSYISGVGGKKYICLQDFSKRGIKVIWHDFSYPVYKQVNTSSFIPNLCYLDLLFNCGIEKSRELFWNNVRQGRENI